ncbi:MAG: transposase [Phycisphaerae bacterium]|nr:transposase [Phycisphaerae bacterium]
MVEQTRQRSRWPIGRTPRALEIARGNYYRWRRAPRWERSRARSPYELLDVRPDIQSDHGSGFIGRDFAETLAELGVTHTKIRPHTPTDNAEIERYHRTIGERIAEHELADVTEAKAVIAAIIAHYNQHRLHAALSYLRPVDYYRGDPAALLAERRWKLQTARELRKQENIKLRQRRLPWTDAKTVSYPKRRVVSL